MKKAHLFLMSAAVALSLSACVSPPTLAPAGNLTYGQSLKLDRDWSDVSPQFNSVNKKGQTLDH